MTGRFCATGQYHERCANGWFAPAWLFFLIATDGQTSSTAIAAALQGVSTLLGAHSLAKAMDLGRATLLRLIGTFWHTFLIISYLLYKINRTKSILKIYHHVNRIASTPWTVLVFWLYTVHQQLVHVR
jgi:hypothetical protein